MALPIENDALISDCRTATLIGRDGSIGWLCVPRLDSGACFAAILGEPKHDRSRRRSAVRGVRFASRAGQARLAHGPAPRRRRP